MKDAANLSLRDVSGGAVLAVKVVPGASRDRLIGVLGDSLKVTTSAAPEKGKANAAVAAILAKALGLHSRDVELLSGGGSARKEFVVRGVTAASIRATLEELP